jgi:hypothetical protein
MQKTQLFVFLLILFFVSCNKTQSDEKLADERLNRIEQFINENAFNTAKIQIDSIHSLFPRLVEKRRIAAALYDTIVRRESARTLAYCDSILPIKKREAESIQQNFRFEKNPAYQQIGNYVYKSMGAESNANRTYLKTYVDENADLYLVSNHTGAKIEHISVKVSVDDLFAQTDTVKLSSSAHHSFNDEGTYFESVTFKNDAEKGVTAFIAQFATMRIKVALLGKKNYTYFLTDADKKAIAETYHLWIVMKDVAQLEKEIKKAKLKIARIKQRNIDKNSDLIK